ncbi:MAG: hypothetical protein HQ543_11630 [Bacteroidetes bacterium]|nr:hypothetical protein [Bacteroidota bacterium]
MTEKKNTTEEKNMQKKTAPKTKNTNKKAATTTKKKAVSVKETPVQKTTEQEKTRFWKEAIKNIATGADVVVDHASEVGGQASEVMGKVWDQMKDISSKAFNQSAQFVDEVAVSAYGYAKKYQGNIEIKSLNKEKAKIGIKLGLMLHLESKNKKDLDPEFLKRKDIDELLKELDIIDKKIVTLGRKYDKS